MYQQRTEVVSLSHYYVLFSSHENVHLELNLEETPGLFYTTILIPAEVFIESLSKTTYALGLSSWKKKKKWLLFLCQKDTKGDYHRKSREALEAELGLR